MRGDSTSAFGQSAFVRAQSARVLAHGGFVRALRVNVLVQRHILFAKCDGLLSQSAPLDDHWSRVSSQREAFETKSRSFIAKRHSLIDLRHIVRAQTEKVLVHGCSISYSGGTLSTESRRIGRKRATSQSHSGRMHRRARLSVSSGSSSGPTREAVLPSPHQRCHVLVLHSTSGPCREGS